MTYLNRRERPVECAACGRTFMSRHSFKNTCSPDCRDAYRKTMQPVWKKRVRAKNPQRYRDYNKGWRRRNREKVNARHRAFKAARRVAEKLLICAVCKVEFMAPRRARTNACSDDCRFNRARFIRHRSADKPEQRARHRRASIRRRDMEAIAGLPENLANACLEAREAYRLMQKIWATMKGQKCTTPQQTCATDSASSSMT